MTELVRSLRQAADAHAGESMPATASLLYEAAAHIERLTAALHRIDGINDNPAVYNRDINDVLERALKDSTS